MVVDYVGSIDGEPFDGGEGRDQLIELGSGRLIPGFEDQLKGASAGDERTVKVTFPDDYGAEHLAGKDAEFAVTVKEIKRKHLPELDDDFASDAAGFDTLDELREDIGAKLREADERALEAEFREAALDAVVDGARSRCPTRSSTRAPRSCGTACCTRSRTRASTGRPTCGSPGATEEEILAEAKPDAEQALRREAVIAAIIEAEGIEATDDDILDALQTTAARESTTPEKLRERLREGRPPRRPARGSSRARRSTSSPSRAKPIPSSRPRRATSSGRPTRATRRRSPPSSGPRAPARRADV